ncbi:MAG TPA: hypothetical protein VGF20_13130, partial [Candidatus Acidoferrum sp.]
LLCVVFSWIHNSYRLKVLVHFFATESAKSNHLLHQNRGIILDRSTKLFESAKTPEVDLGHFFMASRDFFQRLRDASQTSLQESLDKLRQSEKTAVTFGGIAFLFLISGFVLLMIFTERNLWRL